MRSWTKSPAAEQDGGTLSRTIRGLGPNAVDGSESDATLLTRVRHLEILYRLSTDAVRATDLRCVYEAALDAVVDGLEADRASLLLFDPDGTLRFKASRALSPEYMNRVEGHTPWAPDTPDPVPILVPDVRDDVDLRPYLDVILEEGIYSLAFVPLRHEGRVIGKFMAYFNEPHEYTIDEVRLAEMIANHLAIVLARRRAEKEREVFHAERETERAQLEAVLKHIPHAVAIVGAQDEHVVLQNVAAETLWPRAEPAIRSGDLLMRVLTKGEVIVDAEVELSRSDGVGGHILVSGSPLQNDEGTITSAVFVLEDISGRKRNESALRFLADATLALAESLDYEQTLQNVAELMVPSFADWCDFDLINEKGELELISIVHSEPEKIELARSLRETYPPSTAGDSGIGQVVRTKKLLFLPRVTDEMLEASARDEAHLEILKKLQLGSAIVVPLIARGRVLGTLTLIMAESGRHYVEGDIPYVEELAQSCALAVDNARLYAEARRELGERMKVESALRDSEERYRMLSEATSDYIFSYERNPTTGRFELEWISEAFERITGYSREQIKDRDRWIQMIHPDDVEQVIAFSKSMERGERHVMEHRVRARDGSERWLRIYGRPVPNPATGEISRVLGAGQDITARKQAEHALQELAETLEGRVEERTRELADANERLQIEVQVRSRAEDQLARANSALRTSNRELQDFAYVASHDLQEPLRKIQSFADLLRSDYGRLIDDQGNFYIQRMQTAAGRMSDLIKGLLNYSRVRTQGNPFEEVDLKAIVEEVISDLEITISETRGAITVQDLPTVEADPTQMRQLFQNLIGNALKFRDPSRAPVVRVSGSTDDARCSIEIEDNGIGFPAQYADRIFSPFQRLHGRSTYPGTGIGLAICRRIVERHGGVISAEGVPTEGARFHIILPLRQDEWSNGFDGLSAQL